MPLGFPIVDPHIHLWDPGSTPREVTPAVKLFGWNDRLLRALGPRLFPKSALDFVGVIDHVMAPYLPGTYRRDTGGWAVRGYVYVQAGWKEKGALGPVGETRWAEAIGGRDMLGIVGDARLSDPELGHLLDAHQQASARFVGVRDMTAHDADAGVMDFDAHPGRMADPAWRRGFAELGRRGLTFDTWMYSEQLGELRALLRDHEGTKVVLDHLGTPIGVGGPYAGQGQSAADRARRFERWSADLEALAAHPNLCVKVSGLTMPILGWPFGERSSPPSVRQVVDALGPMVETALAHFGADRCLFASNFPMDKAVLPWTTLYEAFAQLTASHGEAVQRRLFHDNAVAFYGLDD
ncbi:MAG: amidohydrolase family protein [Deltaproteobacteria bacterium]|nr:amidohydrolase family protein [Deltaproteobacteria bacterium]